MKSSAQPLDIAAMLRRQASEPPTKGLSLFSSGAFRNLDLARLEPTASARAKQIIPDARIQRVDLHPDGDAAKIRFVFHGGPAQSKMVWVDLAPGGAVQAVTPHQGLAATNFATVSDLSAVRVPLHVAAAKVFAHPGLTGARFHNAALGVESGKLVYQFWHSADWAREANVLVDAGTGAVTVKRFDPKKLDLVVTDRFG